MGEPGSWLMHKAPAIKMLLKQQNERKKWNLHPLHLEYFLQ